MSLIHTCSNCKKTFICHGKGGSFHNCGTNKVNERNILNRCVCDNCYGNCGTHAVDVTLKPRKKGRIVGERIYQEAEK